MLFVDAFSSSRACFCAQERLGLVYRTLRMQTPWSACFYELLLTKAMLLGLLVGLQQGAGVAVQSAAAAGLNATAYVIVCGFAAVVLLTRPRSSVAQNVVEGVVVVVDCGIWFTVMLLAYLTGSTRTQEAGFWMQVGGVVVAVLTLGLGSVPACHVMLSEPRQLEHMQHVKCSILCLVMGASLGACTNGVNIMAARRRE